MRDALEQTVDPVRFRGGLGAFPTGVTVITARGRAGDPVGLTANAFTSVSLDPPMILACVGRNTSSYEAMMAADRFAVHVLAADQHEISTTFARSASDGIDKFAEVAWTPDADGLPLLDDYLTRLTCRPTERITAGDHVVLISEVESLETDDRDRAPLGFLRGRYATLS